MWNGTRYLLFSLEGVLVYTWMWSLTGEERSGNSSRWYCTKSKLSKQESKISVLKISLGRWPFSAPTSSQSVPSPTFLSGHTLKKFLSFLGQRSRDRSKNLNAWNCHEGKFFFNYFVFGGKGSPERPVRHGLDGKTAVKVDQTVRRFAPQILNGSGII